MQDTKTFPTMLKHNILCNIIRRNVKLIYSGEGCSEEEIDRNNIIKGKVICVKNDTFDFEFENGTTKTLTIKNFDGFELQWVVVDNKEAMFGRI